MLKWLRSIDWRAIGASALILAAFLVFISQVSPQTQENAASSQRARQVITPPSTDERLADYTEGLEWFTGLLALVTVVLAGASIWQGYLTDQSINLSRDEFIASHRPKIILRESYVVDEATIQNKTIPAHIICTLSNVGETDGTIVLSKMSTHVRYVVGRLRLPDLTENEIGDVTIAPGETRTYLVPGMFSLETFPPGDKDESVGSFLVGKIIYRDTAGIRRQTAFVRKFNPKRRRFYPILDRQLNYAD